MVSVMSISGDKKRAPRMDQTIKIDKVKKRPSIKMVTKTMVVVLPAEIFSLVNRKSAIAVPPTLEGVAHELNSHKLTRSKHCRQFKS